MRIETRDNSSIFTSPDFAQLFDALSLHLDGQRITLRIAETEDNGAIIGLVGGLLRQELGPRLLNAELGDVVVEMPQEGQDIVLVVDFSAQSLADDRAWVKLSEVRFNDWNTQGPPAFFWDQDGLRMRLSFESSQHEVQVKILTPVGPTWVDLQVDGFYLDLHLVPFTYWAPSLSEPIATGAPHSLFLGIGDLARLNVRDMVRQGCALFVDFGWASFFPDVCGAEDTARGALHQLARELAASIPAESVYPIFDALVVGERGLLQLGDPSTLRGVDIGPGQARFLFAEGGDDLDDFAGQGRIVAVYKDHRGAHLDGQGGDPRERQHWVPDDLYAVVVERPDSSQVTVNAIGLAESIASGQADIEGVHVVQPTQGDWGRLQCNLPWGPMTGRYQRQVRLAWPPHLRSNRDEHADNNLDALPERSWPSGDPLYATLYDGALFFVHNVEGHRTLYPRAWHLPRHDARRVERVDGFVREDGLFDETFGFTSRDGSPLFDGWWTGGLERCPGWSPNSGGTCTSLLRGWVKSHKLPGQTTQPGRA